MAPPKLLRTSSEQALQLERPHDKEAFMLEQFDKSKGELHQLGWLSYENMPLEWNLGNAFAVPPVLLLDVRSDICTITEHVRKKLEALPYKVVEPHGATADKRFPKLLEHLRRGGKERAAVLSTAKTERRSPRGRGGESLPGFFYLTDRKLYYYGHEQGAPHMFE